MITVTQVIKGLMEDRDISQAELAEWIGVSKGYICQMINGHRSWRPEKVKQICAAMRLPTYHSTLIVRLAEFERMEATTLRYCQEAYEDTIQRIKDTQHG